MFRYKSVILLGFVGLLLSGCANTVPPGNTTNNVVVSNESTSISVSGSSVRKVEPDVARVRFSIYTEESTPDEGQKKNTEDVNRVIAVIKEFGVAENKIKTENYQIYPNYEYNYDEYGMEKERVLSGYTVTNSLVVSGLDISRVGELITACVEAGINNVDGIDYTCSNYDEIYNEVLSDAINIAKKKAEVIASSSGVTLGSVKSVAEGWQDTSYRYSNNMAMNDVAYEMESSGSNMKVMAGELEIRANVDVNFEIQ